ncbi:hypothetical protein OPV22_023580 [Ensete ventricosum]|uniref:Plus3 domain-containing protein n=1 Tax=Ensete ventricosum TaxID=4639 RepID=A0AAV8QR04_ENSVE|nr:hypothetical protein OPV22_023580 [Ensete ventricosum]
MRFLSQEEHEDLVKSVIEERKIRRRIQELQECRAAGCRTLAEAKAYTEQKRKRELEASTQNSKENTRVHSGQVSVRSFDEWDITGLPGTELLSETEQEFCRQNRLLPSHYLKMQETLVQEIYKGNIANKSDGVNRVLKPSVRTRFLVLSRSRSHRFRLPSFGFESSNPRKKEIHVSLGTRAQEASLLSMKQKFLGSSCSGSSSLVVEKLKCSETVMLKYASSGKGKQEKCFLSRLRLYKLSGEVIVLVARQLPL